MQVFKSAVRYASGVGYLTNWLRRLSIFRELFALTLLVELGRAFYA